MNARILAQLDELERAENIRLLYAAESGSRAWGFASPDSDYDVRFVYVRRVADYLKLEKLRDVVEWRRDEVLDINGWDLAKALRLLRASNPTLFEWSRSPVVYRTTEEWRAVQREMDRHFLTKTGLHHYLGTAMRNYRDFLLGETVRMKKYFYVLRPLLACLWILNRKKPPPMQFSVLVDAEMEAEARPAVELLWQRKCNAPEVGECGRMDALNAYIVRTAARVEKEIARWPSDEKPGWERLDALFLDMLRIASPDGRL